MQGIVLAAGEEHHKAEDGGETDLRLVDVADGDQYTITLVGRLNRIPSIATVHVATRNSVAKELRQQAAESEKHPVITVVDQGDIDDVRQDAIGHLLLTIERQKIDDDVVVVGGENWFTYDLEDFVAKARGHSSALIVTQVEPGTRPDRFGWVKIDASDRVTAFEEHPEVLESNAYFWASCVYFFNRETLDLLRDFAKEKTERASPGDFVSWLVARGSDVYGICAQAHSEQALMRGPDFLEWRDLVRIAANPRYSTWEKEAARALSHVSSHTELIEALRHESVNTRIVAAHLLGESERFLDESALEMVRQHLLQALADGAENDVEYGGSEDDENSAFFVSATAAASLVKLGFADDVAAVWQKARDDGFVVVECENRL